MKKLLLLIWIGILSISMGFSQMDSLNPGLAKDCIRSLNFSDRMFEEENYDISYKYWQVGYNICDKDIGSGMYYLGEALLEYRLFELGPEESKKLLLDSLINLIEERQKLYGNELQLKGQEPFSASKKLAAIKVFYGLNEKCEYIRFGKSTFGNGFDIETFPALLWEDHYQSIAVALVEENDEAKMNFIFDFDENFSIPKNGVLEFILKDGTKVIAKAISNAKANGVKKFKNVIYRAKAVYKITSTELAALGNPDNPINKLVIQTGNKKYIEEPQYEEALSGLIRCLR